MAVKTEIIRVLVEDKERFVNQCVALFLKEHPEFKGMKLSHAFIFKKVIDYYLS